LPLPFEIDPNYSILNHVRKGTTPQMDVRVDTLKEPPPYDLAEAEKLILSKHLGFDLKGGLRLEDYYRLEKKIEEFQLKRWNELDSYEEEVRIFRIYFHAKNYFFPRRR
ncbi:MAG: hypothetical protein R3257_07885, partial [bacterium]|nr:hypothetical protein [bacterium]